MTFKTISHSEFDRLLPDNLDLENLMMEQVEWFSDRSGSLLGTIAEGKSGAGWNYAVLKRDRKGDFHVRKVMNNFFNLKAARVDLLLSMAGIEKIHCVNRGTADFRLPPMKAELFALNPSQQHAQQSKACSRSVKMSE
jgi:hypothetical protein